MGSYEVFFLQMQPYLISHLKLVWYPMLIMALACTWHWISAKYHELVVGCVGFIQQIWLLNQPQSSMGGLFLCSCNGKSYVNGGQWLEPQAHLKRVVANRVWRDLL
jgi:hypothetical protein